MHVDISRDTFDTKNPFLRVLQEQGGVVLDADANEQTAILLDRLHKLAADVFGPHWGPADGAGFKIEGALATGYTVSKGPYSVGGRRCLNSQTFEVIPKDAKLPDDPCLAYLDTWERVESPAERDRTRPRDADPGLGDVAPAPRTRLECVVRFAAETKDIAGAVRVLEDAKKKKADNLALAVSAVQRLDDIRNQQEVVAAQLALRAAALNTASALCNAAPGVPSDTRSVLWARSGYRAFLDDPTGKTAFVVNDPENQLYRVEVHKGGEATSKGDGATFKWSADNGAFTFAVVPAKFDPPGKPDDTTRYTRVELRSPLSEDERVLVKGVVVEYGDRTTTMDPATGPDRLPDTDPRRYLFEVHSVETTETDPPVSTVTLIVPKGAGVLNTADANSWAHLRVWHTAAKWAVKDLPDQGKGALATATAADGALGVVARGDDVWLDLDGRVQIRFNDGKTYRAGDYWLVPLRAATGDVIWDEVEVLDKVDGKKVKKPDSRRATPTADHAAAPLARIAGGKVTHDLRRVLDAARIEELFVTQ